MICTCLSKETVLLLFLGGALEAPPAPPIPQAQFKDVSDLDLLEILNVHMTLKWQVPHIFDRKTVFTAFVC